MSGAPKRLSKVAKEFNVATSTISEFLSKNGHEVGSSPNAKISAEQYDLIVSQYGRDKADKEKSQELKQQRVERKTITLEGHEEKGKKVEEAAAEGEAASKEETATPSEAATDEKPATEEKSSGDGNEPKIEPVDGNFDGESGPTVLGKIDLDSMNLKSRPEKESKKTKVETPKAEPKKEAPKKMTEEQRIIERQKRQKEAAKAKAAQAKIDAQKAKVDEAKRKEAAAKEAEEKKQKEAEAKVKVEPETIKANVQKLSGPTVLGKIELPSKPAKKKPVASSNDKRNDNKKKRQRIQKKGASVNQEANKVQQNNNNNSNNNNNNRRGPGNNNNRNNQNRNQRGGNRRNQVKKPELTEKDIQKEIKDTLARLSSKGKNKGAKLRREKRQAAAERSEAELAKQEAEKSILKVTEFVTASELAAMMDVSVNEVISACMTLGLMVSINQRLDAETLTIVAEEFGFQTEFVGLEEEEEEEEEIIDAPEDLEPRPPIVTVMGHVDHGKTSLLDYIRDANVIGGEAGGITQHIGAYNVEVEGGRSITFLDTPGHEAFTAMRARGAQVTDLAIIVIAADDSVMPQTKEAINHAQAADVPMIFAFNKIDKPGANPDKIREELSAMNILVEEWGGKYQTQEISAKKGQGIDELLEKVLLESDMLELKANPNRLATGTVIEASLDKGRGYVSTLLVQQGTLNVGDLLVAGSYFGKVKALFNERGQRVEKAGPSMPVSMLGFDGASTAGDTFKEYAEEKEAKSIASKREQLQREQGIRTQKHITLDEIGRRLALGDFQELNVIVKGDVDGSVEALSDSLIKLSTDSIQVNVIHKQVGQITESDVLLATASDAIIIGFQVRPSGSARKLAEQEEIDIRLYSVIYKAIEELQDAMEGMLKPVFEEQVVCNIEIRETFKISKVGTIAGCYVQSGKVTRNTKVRLIREGIVVYTGKLGSLKRFKDDVKEVSAGYECGLNIENYNDIKVGDIIEGYEEVEVKQKL